MIPPDVASSLRQILPDQQAATNQRTQPVPAAQKLADVLADLQPGQRVMAEVQALLPNGTYRAMVAQRDVTLALPFSAKVGDSLELEVVESDGKITLAFVANRTSGPQAAGQGTESVPTTLSQTGRLIGRLIGNLDESGGRAAPAPLNGNQPLLKRFLDAAQLAPILKEALSQSGVFYEAHQARWVAGQLPTEALRLEPQGKLPPQQPPLSPSGGETSAADTTAPTAAAPRSEQVTPAGTSPGNPIPRELMPIIQQQLDALATQNYAWQGQIWPGQKMWWEITEDYNAPSRRDDEASNRWQTRLKLSLPALGGIEATLRLQPGGRVEIRMTADTTDSEARLRNNGEALSKHFAAAGLDLVQLLVEHGAPAA